MTRRVMLDCDWRGCPNSADYPDMLEMPAGWGEVAIQLRTSGPLPEDAHNWQALATHQGTSKVLYLCPEHLGRVLMISVK